MTASKIEYSSFYAQRGTRLFRRLTLTLLVVEFLDEIVDGTLRGAWPFIRQDLSLSYVDIGLLATVPSFTANLLIEPLIGILADVWRRRVLILAGGVCFAIALMLAAGSWSFAPLMLAFILLFPASGAFVNISQVVLVDSNPLRREQSMARWTLSGTIGNIAGPAALSLFIVAGMGGWRGLFVSIAASMLLTVIAVSRFHISEPERSTERSSLHDLFDGIGAALQALKRREVLRWLLLLELADIMDSGLQTYLALYFVDVAGLDEAEAGLALLVWMGATLPGDILLIPLLERVRGLSYLRWSAAAALCSLILFLAAPSVSLKLLALGLMGFASAGWYAILKAQLYESMEGRSGTVLTVCNAAALAGEAVPLALGLAAAGFGLKAAMWLMLIGPAALLLLIPRGHKK